MGYRLRQGISYCIASGRTVLFDLPNCRYLALEDLADNAFQTLVSGGSLKDAQRDELNTLAMSGVIINEDTSTNDLSCSEALAISRSLINERRPCAGPWTVVRATLSQLEAEARLKCQPLEDIFVTLQKQQRNVRTLSHVSVETLGEVCSAFYWSQRLIASGTKCLRRSIALASYLGARGIACNLVIGVRMRPFAAHAWVQQGDLVLNETVDEARRYSTILVV